MSVTLIFPPVIYHFFDALSADLRWKTPPFWFTEAGYNEGINHSQKQALIRIWDTSMCE